MRAPKPRLRSPGVVAAILVLLLVGWVFAPPSFAAPESGSVEYAVKANYLYKFGPFVEWPPHAFQSASSPFYVCVSGRDPFGATLDAAVRGQTVGGRPVAVRRLGPITSTPDCHVLYIGRSREQTNAEVLKRVRSAPILTVTDDRQGSTGGIIQFVLRKGRIRFAIDVGAARESGLGISSKLQSLAVPLRQAGD